MKIFELKADHMHYASMGIVDRAHWDWLGYFNGKSLPAQLKDGSLAVRVIDSPVPEMYLVREPSLKDRIRPLGDICYMTLGAPVFSAKAIEVLKDLLLPWGEFIPLKSDKGEFHAFNVLNVIDILDVEKSDMLLFDEDKNADRTTVVPMEINTYAFRPTRDSHVSSIFKIPQSVTTTVYVTDEFVDRWNSSGLEGADFRLLWED